MKKSTVLLAVFLMVFVIAIPSSANKLTLTGEYINSGVGAGLLEEEGFDNMLSPHSLSLNLGYTYKDTEFNIGIKNFDLGYDVNSSAERYIVGQSIYAGIDSKNFEFSYLRGNYEKYAFDADDDVIGFNFAFQDLNLNLPFNTNRYNYLLPEFDNHLEYSVVNKTLFRARITLGKLNVVGYYFDSSRIYTELNYFDPYSVYSSRFFDTQILGSTANFFGPAVNASLNLSPYFNVGVTYSDISYIYTYGGSYTLETLNFNIHGKLPILSGGYFVNALKTVYAPINYVTDPIESDKYTFYVGLEEVGLRDDSKVKVGLDYIYTDKNTKLFQSYDSALGQMGIYKELDTQKLYEIIHRAGVSLGIDFTENLSLDLNNGILFSKNPVDSKMKMLGNITTLNFNYADVKDNKFSIYVLNNYDLFSRGNNKENTLYAEAFGKINIGDVVDVGVRSENKYSFIETVEPNFYGATNLWLVSDMFFDLGKSTSVGVTLGGSVGVIYGNGYNDILDKNIVGEKLGRFSYDVYAGVNARPVNKLGLQFGIYAGTNTYIAHAIAAPYAFNQPVVRDFNWSDVNLVASTTIGYDVSEKTTLSLTGTYRNWKYMLTKDDDGRTKIVNIAEEFDTVVNTRYFVQAKVTFKPTKNVNVSLAVGNNGLAPAKATQTDKAMPWDYLKIPITTDFKDLWKRIELNVSINF